MIFIRLAKRLVMTQAKGQAGYRTMLMVNNTICRNPSTG